MQTLGLINKVICTSRLISLFVLFKAGSASFHSVCLNISKCYDGSHPCTQATYSCTAIIPQEDEELLFSTDSVSFVCQNNSFTLWEN